MRGKQKAKRLKRTPVDCGDLWGWQCADVAVSMDWEKLQRAFDTLTSPPLWANKLSFQKVASALPLECLDSGLDGSASKLSIWAATSRSDPSGSSFKSSPSFLVSSAIAMQESAATGRGWYARAPLDAGVMLLVERPVVAVLDGEWRDECWAECGSSDSAALGIELARCHSASLALLLSGFHPQEGAATNGADSDEEDEPMLKAAMKEAVDNAWKQADISKAAQSRLEDVVRLNSLGFYTNSEQLCHHDNFAALTGNGLFSLASGFNHSCEPSVQRYSLGDLTMFVTNRPVEAGAELCISYIESELLCAPKSLRSQSLNRDFVCACSRCKAEGSLSDDASAGRRNFMRVDSQVQAKLALLPPQERVKAVAAALQGHLDEGEEEPEEEEPVEDEAGAVGSDHHSVTEQPGARGPETAATAATTATVVLLGKDAQELRVVQALALMQMEDWQGALQVWRQNAAFTCHHCPPFDEALVVYAMQAALCNAQIAPRGGAAGIDYVHLAVEAHRRAFGADNFVWRYAKEVAESRASPETKDAFRRAAKEQVPRSRPFTEVVRDWCFKEDEVPPAFQCFS
ncbi:SET6 [Symbiodinium natans]|uniref:SET6 protein n=1 Tax=Symbiodinium natans TaxID=878477 RepID=A0A812RS12_9DINO|nr:SET6 [Symbiodinium natans]